ncbi:MAG: inositol monophosphatase family protein [Thermodesulfobacteriota bacterium]
MHRIDPCLAACADVELRERLAVAAKAALAAGTLLREYFDQPFAVRNKGAIDLVTEADVAAEEVVLNILRGAFPADAVLAEESANQYQGAPAGRAWVVDPLDGTTNFAHHFPWFAVSIAAVGGDASRAGVIYAPMLDELFCAAAGAGAWLNGNRLAVSSAATLQESLLATGFPYTIRERSSEVLAAVAALLPEAQGLRRAGAAAMDLAYVAAGRLDGFWEINLKPWDTAAGILLLAEAGGTVSTYSGRPYTPYVPELVASNGRIHQAMVERLTPFANRF